MHQIMLSVHCGSMLGPATELYHFLVERGYTVFLCSFLEAGDTYRTQICENAAKCEVFVPFMNAGWCTSGECEYEFNIAIARNLKSPTRTPHIVPILLEEFSYYANYPAIFGFLSNANGIVAHLNDLEPKLWKRVLVTISDYRKVIPVNPPKLTAPPIETHGDLTSISPSPTAQHKAPPEQEEAFNERKPLKPTKPKAAATPPAVHKEPAQQQEDLNDRKPLKKSDPTPPTITIDEPDPNERKPLRPSTSGGNLGKVPDTQQQYSNEERQPLRPAGSALSTPPRTRANSASPAPLKDLESLVKTSLQLITDIKDSEVTDATQLLEQLRNVVQPIIESLDRTAQVETCLRALMDYLSKIKDLCAAATATPTKQLAQSSVLLDNVVKLARIVENPTGAWKVSEFITEPQTRMFWEKHFGETEFSTTWSKFESALTGESQYKAILGADAEDTLKDLRLRVDHHNTGHVVCHRVADFVGKEPLLVALLKYKEKTVPVDSVKPPDVHFPLLLWIDDRPENNEFMVEYAKELGICVVPLKSTAFAKQWLVKHSKVMEEKDAHQVRIITDNARSGANTVLDTNAGEDLIRFVRGRRSVVPILVYCGNVAYAQYVNKYKFCQVTTRGSECQSFIEGLLQQE